MGSAATGPFSIPIPSADCRGHIGHPEFLEGSWNHGVRTVQLSCWLHSTESRPENRSMCDPEVKDFHLKPSLAPTQGDIIQRGSWKSFQTRFFPRRSAKCMCQQRIKQHICCGHESGERGNGEGRT